MRVQYTKAKTAAERKLFMSKASRYIGIDFPLSFIQKVDVYLGYLNDEVMCGFIIVNNKEELRSLACIPSTHRKISSKFVCQAAEVTGLWVDENQRSLIQTIEMSRFIAAELENTGKKYGLIIYNPENRKLQNFYKLLKGRLLYQGMTTKIPGMKKSEFERVEFFLIKEMKNNFVSKFEKAARFIGSNAHAI